MKRNIYCYVFFCFKLFSLYLQKHYNNIMKYDHNKKDFLAALGLDETITDLAFSALISHVKDRKPISKVLEDIAITCEKEFGSDSDKTHFNVKLVTIGFIMALALDKAMEKISADPMSSILNDFRERTLKKASKQSIDFESEIADFFPPLKEIKKEVKTKKVKNVKNSDPELIFNVFDLMDSIQRDINSRKENNDNQ